MARPIVTRSQTSKTVAALGLTMLMAGCGGGGQSPVSPARTPSPTRTPAPIPPPVPLGGTLFGLVFEQTSNGPVPVTGVWVYCDACGPEGHSGTYTDDDGMYSIEGAPAGGTLLLLDKAGYKLPRPDLMLPGGYMGGMNAPVNGDSRFDIEVVRQ